MVACSIGAAAAVEIFCTAKNTTAYLLTRGFFRQCFSFPPSGFPEGGRLAASEKKNGSSTFARGGVKGANVRPFEALTPD